jgi:hypothetical protein
MILPQYPIYIVSKGRWESRLTSKSFEEMGIPYYIVIEPQEYNNYAAVIDPKKILVMCEGNLGLGSIPARNFAWEHAAARGFKWHWNCDDNIRGFCRLYHNERIPVIRGGGIFKAAEDFTERYENVGISGFTHRFSGGGSRRKKPPIKLNMAVYSCMLIKTDLPLRFRGKYNEDSDISIRVLKAGLCTIIFNAFIANKPATCTMKGGNTDEIHAGDGFLKRAEYLHEEFPDIAEVGERWGRYQHVVSYNNKLVKKEGLIIPEGINNYGMKLVEKD